MCALQDMARFIEKDLVHLFDDKGIDSSMYDNEVVGVPALSRCMS
jgi:hypothetical protein